MASFAHEPKFTDTCWTTTFKIVAALQSMPGADPENDPKFTDTLWNLDRKWEKALENME